MNERIKKLAEQATEEIANPFDPWQYDKFFNQEKFAELIVRECMNLTEGCRDKYLNSAPYKIAEHFGVE